MRLIMMGTGPFAATQEDVNPLRAIAAEHGTPIFEPESINTDEARRELAAHQSELFVVCDYGQILSPETLAAARLGGINLHASLLPKYRGAAPINWAIYHGDAETGVTVLHMNPKVDAGPALAQLRTPIGPEETASQLEPRLAELGAPLVLQVIEDLGRGEPQGIEQDPALATRARRLRKTDGAIDWTRAAAAIKNQVRALEPWPKTYTHWLRSAGEPLRVILDKVKVVSNAGTSTPGSVLAAGGEELVISAGEGALRIERLQPAGKRVLTAAEFLRGYPVKLGERFG